MLAIGVAAEADQLGVNRRAAGQGVLQFLEHQHAGAFANHQAITAAVVGARRSMRCVVLQAGGIERIEDHGLGGAELLGAAGQHQWQAAELDRLIGVTDALAAAGAGAGGGDNPPGEAEEDADIGRGGVRHHANVGVGVQPVGHRVQQHVAERLDLLGAAGGRTAGDTHAAVPDRRVFQKTGVGERAFGGQHRQS